MKLLLKNKLLISILLFPLAGRAYDFEAEGFYYNINPANRTAEITWGGRSWFTGTPTYVGDIEIPSFILFEDQEFPVTSIGEYAFNNCIDLASVKIPSSITSIDIGAFEGSGLNSIEIPNSVIKIGEKAFFDCRNIVSVDLPDSIIEIGNSAFQDCISLISIKLPNSISFMGRLTFSGCKSLLTVELPNSILEISNGLFQYCDNLTEVIIPNSISIIGSYAFRDCLNLTAIEFPSSIQEIKTEAFSGCKSLVSIEIPNSVSNIWGKAFEKCSKLRSLSLEDGKNSLLFIENDSFNGCPIAQLYIGRPINYYYDSPFDNNINLKNISLGKYVQEAKYIYPEKIENLEVINCYSSIPPVMLEFTSQQYNNTSVNVPIGSLKAYEENLPWQYFRNIEETLPTPFYEAEKITLNFNYISLLIGSNLQLTATVLPDYATDKTIYWSSSEPNVVSVDENGLISAISEGTSIITATCGMVSTTCEITVLSPVFAETILLNLESVNLKVGDSIQLVATVLPYDTTDKTISWTSSNTNIALVSDLGLIIAVSEGTAIITASCGEVTAECEITVVNPIVEVQQVVMNIEKAELNIGETVQLEATVLPEDATDKTVIWNSSNESVASVSEEGLVLAISVGETTIYATCGEVTASCKISVLEDAGIESLLSNPSTTISIYTTDGVLLKKEVYIEEIKTLSKGLYIIKSGNKSYKIAL